MSNIPEYSVTELSFSIKETLELKFDKLYLKGEISGLKDWNGHLLFNLKDKKSIISSRIWHSMVSNLDIIPEEGLEVMALGKISTHMQRSNYNFIIENIKIAGEGALLKLIEDRKKKFKSMGYFEQSAKQEIPKLPSSIGIITSPKGAVIEDMKKCINDRFPSKIILWPVQVQGVKAEKEISNAIKGFNNLKEKQPSVIILARGGGSIEDLMPFNSEEIVYSIYNSKIPIISAIGHETDFTIADLVADCRASTPTAAADLVVPEKKNLEKEILQLASLLDKTIKSLLDNYILRYQILKKAIINPRLILNELNKNYKFHYDNLKKDINKIFYIRSKYLKSTFINKPETLLNKKNILLNKVSKMLMNNFLHLLERKQQILNQRIDVLNSCSYERWLEKGFVIIRDKNNKLIKRKNDTTLKQVININFIDGEILAVVKNINKKK